MDPKHPSRLILASRCKRRADLLRQAGYWFVQVPEAQAPETEAPEAQVLKPVPPALGENVWGPIAARAENFAIELAMQKAKALARTGHQRIKKGAHTIILSAQTFVIDAQGELLDKPRDRDDAEAMLQSLADRAQGQRVVTGVAMLQPDSLAQQTLSDAAQVLLRESQSEQIEAYLESEQWRDRIGGFDRINPPPDLAIQIIGDPTNIQGLPMAKLIKCLEEEWTLKPAEGEM